MSRNLAVSRGVLREQRIAKVQLLIDAIRGVDIDKVTEILRQDARIINGVGSEGHTPLVLAIMVGSSIELINTLINHGANPTLIVGGMIPLVCAIEKGNIELINTLIYHGADPTLVVGSFTPLLYAIEVDSSIELIKTLMDNGAKPNQVVDIFTPLRCAIGKGSIELITMLIDHEANINLVTGSFTPLSYAIEVDSSIELIKTLMDNGANPNQVVDIFTPLGCAIRKGSIELIIMLIDHGANPNLVAGSFTPLLHAIGVDSCIELITTLLDRGANPNQVVGSFTPLLQVAVGEGDNIELVKGLLAYDANVFLTISFSLFGLLDPSKPVVKSLLCHASYLQLEAVTALYPAVLEDLLKSVLLSTLPEGASSNDIALIEPPLAGDAGAEEGTDF